MQEASESRRFTDWPTPLGAIPCEGMRACANAALCPFVLQTRWHALRMPEAVSCVGSLPVTHLRHDGQLVALATQQMGRVDSQVEVDVDDLGVYQDRVACAMLRKPPAVP